MSGKRSSRPLHRVRTRSHRKLKLVLLALGLMSVLIGVGTVLFALTRDKGALIVVGAAYGMLGGGLLATRQALEVMRDDTRRRGVDRQRRRRGASEARPDSAAARDGGA